MRWGIERLDTGELIGTVGFNQWNQKHKRAEIGYELHPQHWGHGYALYICKTKKVRHNYIQETYVHPTHEKNRTIHRSDLPSTKLFFSQPLFSRLSMNMV